MYLDTAPPVEQLTGATSCVQTHPATKGGMPQDGERYMRRKMSSGPAAVLLCALVACGKPPAAGDDARSPGASSAPAGPATTGVPKAQGAPVAEAAPLAAANLGPVSKPGGGFLAERSGIDANLAITIRWSAQIVTGIPAEGLTTSVYNRVAHLECPVTSGAEASYSYFAVMDNPKADPMAPTGSYQPWWNEDCTGTLTVEDTYHHDDPTIAGPEPTVRTKGTRPLKTGDTPLTVETDLNRGRTRYMFISPSTEGFQQEAAPGYPAKLVPASAAPTATMDFTLEGPIGGGKREVAVKGGKLSVDWTFTRKPSKR